MQNANQITRLRAYETIKIVAKAMLNSEKEISYSDLAGQLGLADKTGRGLGPMLDEAARMCKTHGLPNVSAVIVTMASLKAGKPMPSRESFNSAGLWRNTGIHMNEIPEQQNRVRQFDWGAVHWWKLQ